MPKKKPLPTNEAGINALLQIWAVKLPVHKTTLGLDAEAVDDIVHDAANFQYLLNYTAEFRTGVSAYYEFKDTLFDGPEGSVITPISIPAVSMPQDAVPGIIPRMERMRQAIYASPGLTDAIGFDLDVYESDDAPLDPDTLTAELTCTARPNSEVRIQWPKNGMDAMRIEYKVEGDTDWQHVGDPTSSPFIHSKPGALPELRKYRGTYMKKNVTIGNTSPEYTVVTQP